MPIDISGWTPHVTPRFWLKADEYSNPMPTDDGSMGVWADKSGSGNNFSAPTNGTLTSSANGLYNRRIVSFSNNTGFRCPSGATLGQSTPSTGVCQVTMVVELLKGLTSNAFLLDTQVDNSLSRHIIQVLTSGTLQLLTDGGGGAIATTDFVHKEWVVATFQWNGSNSKIRLVSDRIRETVGTVNSSTPSSGATAVGARFDATQRNYVNGKLAEVICYTVVLTAEQQARLEGYLLAKWGFLDPSGPLGSKSHLHYS